MPRPPPVTTTLRSFFIAALLRTARTARIALLRLVVQGRLQRREALHERLGVQRPRHAQRRRVEVVHVELLAQLVAVLVVEPEAERGAGEEHADRDRTHALRPPRF